MQGAQFSFLSLVKNSDISRTRGHRAGLVILLSERHNFAKFLKEGFTSKISEKKSKWSEYSESNEYDVRFHFKSLRLHYAKSDQDLLLQWQVQIRKLFPHLYQNGEISQIRECSKFPYLIEKSVENGYFIHVQTIQYSDKTIFGVFFTK